MKILNKIICRLSDAIEYQILFMKNCKTPIIKLMKRAHITGKFFDLASLSNKD